MKRSYLFLILGLILATAVVFGGGARSVHKTVYGQFATYETGDTAQVMKFTPAYAIDSFTYLDTIITGKPLDTSAVLWVSHPQRMRLTPSAVWDADRTILCTLVTATVALPMATIDPGPTYTTGAKIVDTLVYAINNTTNLKDSILAQDSGTYVKLIDKNTGVYRTARWTWHKALVGGATSTLDTATTAGYITTVAMVCDSMVAKVNAGTGTSNKVTAYDSTTFWIVQSDDPGLAFTFHITDTTTDTVRTQANVTSRSLHKDTLGLVIPLIEDDFRAMGVYGDIIVGASADTNMSLGSSDSGRAWLYSVRIRNGVKVYKPIDSVSAAYLPCTLHVAKAVAANMDTILNEFLDISWYVSDTLTDTTMQTEYPISIDLILTDN